MPSGLCECGCGQKTTVATANDRANGRVKGQPMRFARGHTSKTPDPNRAEKACSGCGVIKPLSDFYPEHRERPDRHDRRRAFMSACKECILARGRGRDHSRYQHHYRRWAEKNPEKRKAQRKVATALANGTLTKPDACESCGGEGPLHAHHNDYGKPLEVCWLCPRCHKAAHAASEETNERL